MSKVQARSEVFVIKDALPPVLGKYKVNVWGEEPFDYVRSYEIQAKSDTLARKDAVSRFEEEMSHLVSGEE